MTIEFGADFARYAALPLVGLRCLGVFAVAPLLGSRFVPVQARVALGIIFALLLVPLAASSAGGAPFASGPADPWGAVLASPAAYLLRCIAELLLGLAIGYLSLLFLAAVQMAGQIIDTELGFGMVSVLDPQSGSQLPLVGSLLNLVALLVFLALDGHLLLLRAVKESVVLVPPGAVGLVAGTGELFLRAFAASFATALKLAAPVLAALFLTSAALGIVARTVPQMNVFVVGLPLRVGVGLAILLLSLPLAGAVLSPALDGVFDTINRLVAGMAG
jgi:flagellar biosynthetic protein FliR